MTHLVDIPAEEIEFVHRYSSAIALGAAHGEPIPGTVFRDPKSGKRRQVVSFAIFKMRVTYRELPAVEFDTKALRDCQLRSWRAWIDRVGAEVGMVRQ